MLVGLLGRLSGWVHARTCKDRLCWLCSEWAMPEHDCVYDPDGECMVTIWTRGSAMERCRSLKEAEVEERALDRWEARQVDDDVALFGEVQA